MCLGLDHRCREETNGRRVTSNSIWIVSVNILLFVLEHCAVIIRDCAIVQAGSCWHLAMEAQV